jgi:hypothetical protein
MKIRLMLILTFCLLAGSIAACSQQGKNEPQTGTAQTVTPLPSPNMTAAIPDTVTAEPSPTTEGAFLLPQDGIRPIAVMIDNEGTRSLPQGGLDKAQIVYEVIVEGGLTRLMPVFWGTNPEMIGPVRSARDYFLDYTMEYDAIYVHVGGSPQAGRDINKLKINEIDGMHVGSDVIWDLTKERGNWQDSYTSMKVLTDYIGKAKFRAATETKFPFEYNASDIIPTAGGSASSITLKYPSMTTKYEYDNTSGTYKRFRYGKAHMERASGKQLEAENIIIQFVPNYDIKGDKAGRQEMNTLGSGKGYFITGGKSIKLKWSKETRSSQTKYTDEVGNPIKLNRGQTWIQIMPMTGKVTIE